MAKIDALTQALASLQQRVLRLDDLDDAAWATVSNSGLTRQAIEAIAGPDRVLRGGRELRALDRLLRTPAREVSDTRSNTRASALPDTHPDGRGVRVANVLLKASRASHALSSREVSALSQQGEFDLAALDAAAWQELGTLGVAVDRLRGRAGADLRLRGPDDLRALFRLLATLDDDGDPQRLEMALLGEGRPPVTTRAGAAYALLQRCFQPYSGELSDLQLTDAAPAASLYALPFHAAELPVRTHKQAPRECFVSAKTMLNRFKRGLADGLNDVTGAHYMARVEDARGRIAGYREDFDAGRRYIDHCLLSGTPVIVGVSYKRDNYNLDGLTDHFIVITGRHTDEEGRLFYTFNEPGNGKSGYRLYVDARSGRLFKPATRPRGYVDEMQFQVTQVRTFAAMPFAQVTGRAAQPAPR